MTGVVKGDEVLTKCEVVREICGRDKGKENEGKERERKDGGKKGRR